MIICDDEQMIQNWMITDIQWIIQVKDNDHVQVDIMYQVNENGVKY